MMAGSNKGGLKFVIQVRNPFRSGKSERFSWMSA